MQLDALNAAGCHPVYQEKVSGTRSDRKELARLLAKVAPGDEVVVTKIDRLSRSMLDLFSIAKRIDDAGARFRALDPAQAMADLDRDMILARTADGKALKRARGTLRDGRPPKLKPTQQAEALARLDYGEALEDIARSYAVSGTTIARLRDKRRRQQAPA